MGVGGSSGVVGIVHTIVGVAGENGGIVTTTTIRTTAAGDNWQDGQAVWQELHHQPITLADGSQTTFGEFNQNDPQVIEVARSFVEARKRAIQDFNLEQNEMMTQRNMAEKDIIGILESLPNGYTDADLDAAEAKLDEVAPEVEYGFLPQPNSINIIENKTLFHYMLDTDGDQMRLNDARFFYNVTVSFFYES